MQKLNRRKYIPEQRLRLDGHLECARNRSASVACVFWVRMAALWETCPASEDRRIAKRLELHHIPKHGS